MPGNNISKKQAAKSPPKTCSSCRFSKPIEGSETAVECRRYPPTITSVVHNQITSHWPLLGVANGCGEWRQ